MEKDRITPIDVQRYLGGVEYPASKDELVDYASGQGAPEAVMDVISELADREYQSPADISKEMGMKS